MLHFATLSLDVLWKKKSGGYLLAKNSKRNFRKESLLDVIFTKGLFKDLLWKKAFVERQTPFYIVFRKFLRRYWKSLQLSRKCVRME